MLFAAAPARANHGEGSIAGTVSDSSGDPIPDICVHAHSKDSGDWEGATTGPDGTYRVGSLGDGDYIVYFFDCSDEPRYISEWYDDKPDEDAATLVPVSGGAEVTGIDATLTLGGSIEGTVTNADGEPLADIGVQVESENWDGFEWTFEDGTYRIEGLLPGEYLISFEDELDEIYAPQWYDGEPTRAAANVVTVAAETTLSGIDAVLEVGGTIGGRVTDVHGEPISGICVGAHDDEENGWARSWTEGDGVYRLTGLAAGSFRIEFEDCEWDFFGSRPRYLSEWYDDRSDFDTADAIEAAPGLHAPGINAQLAHASTPDLALTNLSVERVPVETDLGPVAPNPLQRRVRVEVSNLGDGGADWAMLETWACARNGSCRDIGGESVSLEAGGRVARSFRWNATGMVGDVTVYARVCSSYDSDLSNNDAKTEDFVGVGGTGVGVDVLPGPVQLGGFSPDSPSCEDFFWEDF